MVRKKRKQNNLKFTRQILEDLENAAGHLNIAEQEIKISKDIIDRAVVREFRTMRNGDNK